MPNRAKKTFQKRKKANLSKSFLKKKSKNNPEKIQKNSNDSVRKETHRKKRYRRDGVKRLCLPFNKFIYKNKINIMAKQNTKSHNGLTSKEKTYVICRCQNKSTRYVKLKSLAAKAMKENKIFSIYGSCNAVRKALLERSWVEKIPSNRMSLSKIRNGNFSSKSKIQSELERLLLSNLVDKQNPNLIWRTKDCRLNTGIDMTKDCKTIVNKLEIDAMWTSKQGLCSSLKRNYWFYIEDIAEVNGPRTYDTCDFGEVEGFVKDYKITTCTSLLKWVLSMVANDRPIFATTGKISMNVIVFALNRCKEYLLRKQNKDIDQSIPSVRTEQWHSFLKKYYSIIAKEEIFLTDKGNKLPLYLSYAKFLLKEIYRYRPQLSCEGCHNIWIIKPAYCSRGRGIRMASKLGVIMNLLNKANTKFVIQKYIEEPLLIYDTKFDIRQYYLVTSTYPLTIWMYTDCYLKFSSQKYNLKNYHESIHLTNNAVQRKYKNCLQRHHELPIDNMWDLETYKCYLDKIGKDGIWQNVIYPGMKKSIIGIMLSCQDSLSVSKNRFELYGCDFILDKEYNPWLIEINSCPDLNHTTQVTSKICPAVVSDIIKVVIDYASNPKASTGNFECIYRQPITLPRYGNAAELIVRGCPLPLDYFYRGKIEIEETYDSANINSVSDIKAVLNKLKQYYNVDDIMKQPEEDCFIGNFEKKHKYLCKTEPGHKINASTETIPIKFDIGFENMYNHNYHFREKLNSFESIVLNPIEHVQNMTNIKSFSKNSYSYLSSSDVTEFNFSKLDDGPTGKASIVDFDSFEKITETDLSCSSNGDSFKTSKGEFNSLSEDLLQATSKIVSFIKRKEKEHRETIAH